MKTFKLPKLYSAAVIIPVIAAAAIGFMIGRSGGSEVPVMYGEPSGYVEPVIPALDADTFWTCSMHPQIHQEEPGQCPICGMDLIPVTGGNVAGDNAPRQLHLSTAAVKLAEIQTAPVERRAVTHDILAVGKVAYDETRVRYITSWIPGRIDRLQVDYTGIPVRRGDVLAELYSPELYAAQREYLEAARTSARLSTASLSGIRDTAGLTVTAAREKLRLLGMTGEQFDRLQERGTPAEHIEIYSTIDGVVIQKNATTGMYVNTGTPIYNVADLSNLWVLLNVYESDLPWIGDGQTVTFTSEAYPGETFTGTISFISPVVDTRTRTIDVRVNVPNPDGRLKPDMLVKAVVQSPVDGEAGNIPLVIPRTAPLITGKRAVVYVAVPDEPGTYEGREVTLGPRAGDFYLVSTGLTEGDEVVVNGAFKIDSALQIQAKPSMMNPEGGRTSLAHDHSAMTMSSGDTGAVTLAQMDTGHEAHDMDGMEGMGDTGSMAGTDSSAVMTDMSGMTGDVQSFNAPDAFLAQLDGVYNAYFALKTALSGDSLDDAVTASGQFMAALQKVDMTLLGHDAHMAWMTELAVLNGQGGVIAKADDITKARDAFIPLSASLIKVAKMYGHSGEYTIFRFHCPMANGGAGADWLQNAPELQNPFYGASMLTCGSLVEEYPGGQE